MTSIQPNMCLNKILGSVDHLDGSNTKVFDRNELYVVSLVKFEVSHKYLFVWSFKT